MRQRPRAFTLLEVLLATSLMAVVALAVAQVVSITYRAQRNVRAAGEQRALLAAVERRLVEDLRGVVPPGGIYAAGLVGEGALGGMGEELIAPELAGRVDPDDAPLLESRDRLTLAVYPSTQPFGRELGAGEGSLLSVVYEIDDDPETTERGLVRRVERVRERPAGVEPAPAEQLSADVVGMQLEFFDGQFWAETWDSGGSDTLPTAVQVTFLVLRGEELLKTQTLVALPQGRLTEPLEATQ
jgi:prepilin-type N-terminal cleavage/methylation domain-containing protein